jgi:hypothetical protein
MFKTDQFEVTCLRKPFKVLFLFLDGNIFFLKHFTFLDFSLGNASWMRIIGAT